MRALDKTGIYIDCKKLRRLLQRSQRCMTKSDRIIYGTPALERCGQILADFILAYDFEDERAYYIKKFLAEFYILKLDIETLNEFGIIKTTKDTDGEDLYTKEGKKLVKVGVENPKNLQREMTEIVARLDEGMKRWRSGLVLKDYTKEKGVEK